MLVTRKNETVLEKLVVRPVCKTTIYMVTKRIHIETSKLLDPKNHRQTPFTPPVLSIVLLARTVLDSWVALQQGHALPMTACTETGGDSSKEQVALAHQPSVLRLARVLRKSPASGHEVLRALQLETDAATVPLAPRVPENMLRISWKYLEVSH